MPSLSLGYDFGTESVRVIAVDVSNGRIVGKAAAAYAVIDERLPVLAAGGSHRAGSQAPQPLLPPDYALQDPDEWLSAAASATRAVTSNFPNQSQAVVGIGVAFTSCTMLPCKADGTPLCKAGFADRPLAWPKLWKHHGAKAETDRINSVARDRREPWLDRYGGTIGLEWFFPKILETFNGDRASYDAADVWLEAGDWFVWQLTGAMSSGTPVSGQPVRSTCQAGYKAMWNAGTGFPSREYFETVGLGFGGVLDKLPGEFRSPGERAGVLSPAAAERFGLPAGIPVSTAIIDAHAGVPGAGVADGGTMVLVLGTSSCHMLNSTQEHLVPGVAGVVKGGILPGYYGYETGQASVGDAFAWLVETFNLSHAELTAQAAKLPPGAGGVLALDWLNGCRTPLMDGRLSGAFVGLTLGTTAAQMYRALIEATAFGLRWIVDTLRAGGVPVERFVASGGLPDKSPLLMQIYADVLNEPIALAESSQSVALGAAILGALAAGKDATGHATAADAIKAMARQRKEPVYVPNAEAHRRYQPIYRLYRELANPEGTLAEVMRELRDRGAQ
ncbi:ribulokinase [Humisphaera borealis]|uniref:Ribulokinase n=1 Tax=Humisphaera borealis TaxID=2807512 RepID=A0A7M2WTV2_9BACT|nr:ribulokinase [Humisphaera borealis]QOV88879.1 ribulokinase [Humisphaera borealis]